MCVDSVQFSSVEEFCVFVVVVVVVVVVVYSPRTVSPRNLVMKDSKKVMLMTSSALA